MSVNHHTPQTQGTCSETATVPGPIEKPVMAESTPEVETVEDSHAGTRGLVSSRPTQESVAEGGRVIVIPLPHQVSIFDDLPTAHSTHDCLETQPELWHSESCLKAQSMFVLHVLPSVGTPRVVRETGTICWCWPGGSV